MINLAEYSDAIEQFILNGLNNFTEAEGKPNSMGIYCCPWSGWVSLHFNLKKTLEATNKNCPDFEFVEFDLFDSEEWSKEYESENGTWMNENGMIFQREEGSGDEGLNYFFYGYLRNLIIQLNAKHQLPTTLLQFLDSKYSEKVINAQLEKLGKFIVEKLRDEVLIHHEIRTENILEENEIYVNVKDEELQKTLQDRAVFLKSLSPKQRLILDQLIKSSLDSSIFHFLRSIQENLDKEDGIELTVGNTKVSEMETDLVSGNLFGDYFVWVEHYSKFGPYQH